MTESDEVREQWEQHRGDDAIIGGGWSITVGELKRAIADIPDDYEVMLENAEVEDTDISNVNINDLMPPALGAPGLLVLGGGQIVNAEYAYDQRLDVAHMTDNAPFWVGPGHPRHEDEGEGWKRR